MCANCAERNEQVARLQLLLGALVLRFGTTEDDRAELDVSLDQVANLSNDTGLFMFDLPGSNATRLLLMKGKVIG